RLDYANAEALLPVIEQVLGKGSNASSSAASLPSSGTNGGADAPAPQPVSTSGSGSNGNGIARRGPAIVTRLEGTNALIVAANPDVHRMVGELIRQLATRPDPALVQANDVGVTDSQTRVLTVQWLVMRDALPFAVPNFANGAANGVYVAGGLPADQF